MDWWSSGGGSLAVAELVDKAGAAIYADLLEYYGVDLVEAIRSASPSPRRLLALLRWLPPGCRMRAQLEDEPRLFGWTREAEVGADQWDAIMANMVGTAWGKIKAPDPYPRPGVKRSEKVPKTVRGLASMFGVR